MLRRLIKIGNAFSLHVIVREQPSFGDAIRRCIGIKRLMTMKQNLAFEMKELKRIKVNTGKWRGGETLWIMPVVRPVGTEHHNRALRDPTKTFFPRKHVATRCDIAWICRNLC